MGLSEAEHAQDEGGGRVWKMHVRLGCDESQPNVFVYQQGLLVQRARDEDVTGESDVNLYRE